VIVYESTHRIIDCINDIITLFGPDYEFALAKELTKNFEHILQAPGQDILAWLSAESARIKGEFVVILPALSSQVSDSEDDRILKILLNELPLKQAVKLTGALTNGSKNDIYKKALALQIVSKP
jgi:16S rRNA (cytidine1402-2'-O)-methyltransferase